MQAGDYQIEIANSQEFLEIDEAFLRDVVSRTLAEEHVARAELSLAIVGDEAIRQLNRGYLDHDEPTDVLSFLLGVGQVSRRPRAAPRGAGKFLEGEIVVSAETAVRRAAEFSWSPGEELVLYMVHGLLHLAGYDDLTAAEKRLMRRRERAILALWGLAPRYRRRQPPGSRRRDGRAVAAGGGSGASP
ncbi:MAG TPA: rRNA maturation RNase YbeY [Planctomycetaceae bacterium]|nr:rRNA maturation RNase YbeY [Planctomycetaceae bacterium]